MDSCELFPAVEVASLVLKYLKNPPLARDTEENTCLSIYQAGKKEYNKNWLRRLHIKHIIHTASEVNSRTKFPTAQKSHMIHQVINKRNHACKASAGKIQLEVNYRISVSDFLLYGNCRQVALLLQRDILKMSSKVPRC